MSLTAEHYFEVTSSPDPTREKQRPINAIFQSDLIDNYEVRLSKKKTENLNLGCGHNQLGEFLNIDELFGVTPGVVCDIDICGDAPHLPFRDNSFVLIYSSMVLEHVKNLMPLAEEIWRVLKPNGVMEAHIPWWSSFRTWGDPTHVRAFNEQSFSFWCGNVYRDAIKSETSMGQYAPKCDFELIHNVLVIPDRLRSLSEEDLDHAISYHINTVSSYWVKLKAIKPTAKEEGQSP